MECDHRGLKRSEFLASAAALAAYGAASLPAGAAPAAAQPTPLEALHMLQAGNARFAGGTATHHLEVEARRTAAIAGQQPFALVLSCSDSRVPPEVVFDQGIGSLFVVRVAGNYATSDGIGSFEYAIAHFHSPLLFVLGHSNCGAVKAALDAVNYNQKIGGDLGVVVAGVKPAIYASEKQPGDHFENAIKANVRNAISNIASASPIVREAVAAGKLRLVGGEYAFDTGKVTMVG
jgi:carbonic anhydrase